MKGIPYLQLHKCFKNNVKVRRFAKRLNCSRPTARGYIVTLWLEVLEYKPDGVIDDWEHDEIAEYAEFEGNPDEFIDALLKTRLLKPYQGGYRISGWQKYSGTLEVAKRRSYEREKKRAQRDAVKRDCPGDITGTSRGHNGDVPGTQKNVPKTGVKKTPKNGVKNGDIYKKSARPDAVKSKCPHNVPLEQNRTIYIPNGNVSIPCNSHEDTQNGVINNIELVDNKSWIPSEIVNDLTHRGWRIQFAIEIGRLDKLAPLTAAEFKQAILDTEKINKPNLTYFLDVVESIRKNPGRTKQFYDNSDAARQQRTLDGYIEAMGELGYDINPSGKNSGSHDHVDRIIDISECRTAKEQTSPVGAGLKQLESGNYETDRSMAKKAFQA